MLRKAIRRLANNLWCERLLPTKDVDELIAGNLRRFVKNLGGPLEDLVLRNYEEFARYGASLFLQLSNRKMLKQNSDAYGTFYRACRALRDLLSRSAREVQDEPKFSSLRAVFPSHRIHSSAGDASRDASAGVWDRLTVFSEEAGIVTLPKGAPEKDARWVVFVDPIDGTEFAETLQGGWSLLAVYDRTENEVVATVAGDIFLDRLYWAARGGPAEAIDFITHSWFKLDGGPNPKTELAGSRVNVLTTKVSRFLSVAQQTALLNAIQKNDGRLNLSWGSNLVIQVAAGYADVGLEFTKGFATYDILPGLFIAEKAGLTVIDLTGKPLTSKLDIDAVFAAYRKDPKKPKRTAFVVAKEPSLARQVVDLLKVRPPSQGNGLSS